MKTQEQRYKEWIARHLRRRLLGMSQNTWTYLRNGLTQGKEFDAIRNSKEFKEAVFYVSIIADGMQTADWKKLSRWITYDYGSGTQETTYLLNLLSFIDTEQFVVDYEVEELRIDLGVIITAQNKIIEIEKEQHP